MTHNQPAVDFPSLLTGFLTIYLPVTRGCSTNTVTSYRDTFILLLRFLDRVEGIKSHQVSFLHLTTDRILKFVTWLQQERGNSLATANQRLAAIKSFMRYTQTKAPELITVSKPIIDMIVKKAPEPQLAYLSREGIQVLMATAHEQGGLRDLALLACLYDGAARVQETADLNHADLHATKPVTITVTGKGNKTRIIPLTGRAGDIIARHAASQHASTPNGPLFTSRRDTRLTRAGISAILARHAANAHAAHPTLICSHVTPHMIRHSRAMHLLEDGVNLIYIRDLLGHTSILTTETYAKANPETKRAAIEKASTIIIPEGTYDTQTRADLLNFLATLT